MTHSLSWRDLLAEPATPVPQWVLAWYARVCLAEVGFQVVDSPDAAHAAHASRIAAATVPAGTLQFAPGVGFGCAAPDLVVLGDRKSATAPRPWLGRSLAVLAKALRSLGYDELTLWLGNCYSDDGTRRTQGVGELVAKALEDGVPVLACGQRAHDVLRATRQPVIMVKHPQFFSRFKARQGAKVYEKHLRESGLAPGPWAGKTLPVLGMKGRATIADLVGLPATLCPPNVGAEGHPKRDRGRDPRWATLRTAYVAGVHRTVAEGARALSLDERDAQRRANEEGWHDERQAEEDSRRQRILDQAAEIEGKHLLDARRLAAASLVTALNRLLQKLQGGMELSASEVARLATATLALQGVGAVGQDPDLQRLRGLDPQELLREVQATVQGIGHGQPKPPAGNGNGASSA